MATTGKSQNKSAFLRELFQKNPEVKEAEAAQAWQKAGNEGEISGSLYYNIKSTAGKTGSGSGEAGEAASKSKPKTAPKASPVKRVGRPPSVPRSDSDGKTVPSSPVSKSKTGDRERVLDRVEDGIDNLIVELKQLGGMDEALESLRKVRRVVVRSHEG
jgi:hypothetical protein